MPAYARKSNIYDEFASRRGLIVCSGCNCNLADESINPEETLYVLYIDKRHLQANQPYDVFCEKCIHAGSFPGIKIV